MIPILLLFGLCIHCYGAPSVINVDPKVRYITLGKNLPIPSDTTWKLKAPPGGKLIAQCQPEGKNCKKMKVIFRATKVMANACSGYLIQKFSFIEEATLNIKLDKGAVGVHCNISATTSYMNMDDETIESDEDGIPTDKKTTCPCGTSNKDGGRIVGGKPTLKNEFPWVASLGRVGQPAPDCGCSIITPYHALTAAHCIEPFPKGSVTFKVTVGEHRVDEEDPNKKVVLVKEAIMHENYTRSSVYEPIYDIAVLYLSEKLEFNKYVGPVCMPDRRRDLVGEYLKVVGWGKLQSSRKVGSNQLMKVNLKVVDLNVCGKIFAETIRYKSQICTYHPKKDSCKGDSGGPLVWLNKDTNMFTQYGVVSFGVSCNTSDPAVSTDVSAFMDWIETKIQETQPAEMCY